MNLKQVVEDDVRLYWSGFTIETASIFCFEDVSITLRGSAKTTEARHFDEWVRTKASTIQAQGTTLTVDKKCPVIIKSLDEAGCVNAESSADTLLSKFNPGVIAAIAAGCMVILSIVIIVGIVHYIRRRKAKKLIIRSVNNLALINTMHACIFLYAFVF